MHTIEFLAFRKAPNDGAVEAINGDDSVKITRTVKSLADADFNPAKAEVERSFNVWVTGWRVVDPEPVDQSKALLASLIDVTAMLEHYRSGRAGNWDGSTKGQTLSTLRDAKAAIAAAQAAGVKA